MPLHGATIPHLTALARDLASGRVVPPFTAVRLASCGHRALPASAVAALQGFADAGMTGPQLAAVLSLVVAEREHAREAAPPPELVWSGPEVGHMVSRDTSVVLRGLFTAAEHTVLVAGFVVYAGRAIFASLAARMDANPALSVRFFLNVPREWGDTRRSDAEILRAFAEDFRAKQWPGERLPEVFFDQRALSTQKGPRAVLHAKCVVVDDLRALVTSANFTEAAQERNIEAGALVHDANFARGLRMQFEALVHAGELRRVPGLGDRATG